MKPLFLLLLLSAAGCGVVDKIEEPHWALWEHTKALRVVSESGRYVVLESFSNPARKYKYKADMSVGDTLILNDEIRAQLKIICVR